MPQCSKCRCETSRPGYCKTCMRGYMRFYYANSTEDQKTKTKNRKARWNLKWEAENGMAYGTYWRARNPERARGINRGSRLRRYGLTPEHYDALRRRANGVCEACFSPETEVGRLVVDHCHTTLRIRGLLCSKCNMGVGMFADRSDLLRQAADYLDQRK